MFRKKVLKALAKSVYEEINFDRTLTSNDFKDPEDMYNKLELIMTEQKDADDWEIDVEISATVIPGAHQTRMQPGEPTHVEDVSIKFRQSELDAEEVLTDLGMESIEIEAIESWHDSLEPPEYERD